MAKQVKLQKNGQTVYPQTVGDAVAVAGKTLTAYLQSLAERIEWLESYHTTTTTEGPTEEPTSTTTTTPTPEPDLRINGHNYYKWYVDDDGVQHYYMADVVVTTPNPDYNYMNNDYVYEDGAMVCVATTTTTEDPTGTTPTTGTTSTTTTTEEVAGAKGAIGAAFSDEEEEDTSSLERTVSDYENDNI